MHILRDNSWSRIDPVVVPSPYFNFDSNEFNNSASLIAAHILFLIDYNNYIGDRLSSVSALQPYINRLSEDIRPYHTLTAPATSEEDYRLPVNRSIGHQYELNCYQLTERYSRLLFTYGIQYYPERNIKFEVPFRVTIPNRDYSGEIILASGHLQFDTLDILTSGVQGEITLRRVNWIEPQSVPGPETVTTRRHLYVNPNTTSSHPIQSTGFGIIYSRRG